MAKTHSTNHAAQFCASLSGNQRNALRAILHHEHACRDLRRALGIEKTDTISHAAHATGLARSGRTADLFRDHVRTAQNIPANCYGVSKEVL